LEVLTLVQPLVETKDLTKVYATGNGNLTALDGVTLQINRGDFVAIMGPSGSGKSTLLYLLACLDPPTKGKYFLNGKNVSKASQRQLASLRRKQIGIIFQSFNLLPRTSALENVALPLLYRGESEHKARKISLSALDEVGLADRADHFPNQLSGGEQQRVAIARAVASRPSLLLADEPTGALDSQNSRRIMEMLDALNKGQKQTIVLVTHDDGIAKHANRIIRIRDGSVV
jgi:putative ABC transport system ATP-binding protein